MKKRILFCVENFQHGGINKALENLISVFDHDKYDVGFFVVNQEDGPYKDLFTPYLKYEKDYLLEAYCTYYHKHQGFKKLSLIALKLLRKIGAKCGVDLFKLRLKKWSKRISHDKYDCVIAFAEGYVTEFVSTIKGHKLAWIHIDYKRYLSYAGNHDESAIYEKFDRIVIPSKFSGKSFEEIYPSLTDRIIVIPNVIDSEAVKRGGAEGVISSDLNFRYNQITLISVGRICYEKRFFEIPAVARKLKDMGASFRWYIIGDGSPAETQTLNQAIADNAVEEFVIPLGRKNNPYPYIAKSDLLVSTSISETFSYVVFEAKSLGVPVVCADFGTAPEILNESEGVITSISEMAVEIYKLISHNDTLLKLKDNLKRYKYNNTKILNSIYEMVGDR